MRLTFTGVDLKQQIFVQLCLGFHRVTFNVRSIYLSPDRRQQQFCVRSCILQEKRSDNPVFRSVVSV